MRYFLALAIAFSSLTCNSQAFVTMDTLESVPDKLRAVIDDEIKTVIRIDFNGDTYNDFIVQCPTNEEFKFKEYWVTSEFVIWMTRLRYHVGIEYFNFINVDNDPEPEVYTAFGYEDGIDYALYDLDLKAGTENLLFFLNPIIIAGDNHYWGYSWDIKNMLVKNVDGELKVLSAIDHDIIRDGDVTIPDDQSIVPCVFFNGTSTQPNLKIEEIRNIRWSTIEEIVKTVHNKR